MEKKSIGSFLTALRKASGLTQKQLAEKLNVSDKAVSRWERDECAPDLSLIPVLAEIYGVTSDEILRGQRTDPDKLYHGNGRAKIQKQRQHILRTTKTTFTCRSLAAVTLAIVGALLAYILNTEFAKANTGFLLGCIFFLAAAVCQILFFINGFSAVSDDECQDGPVENCKVFMLLASQGCIGLITSAMAFCIPLAGQDRVPFHSCVLSGVRWICVVAIALLLIFFTLNQFLKRKGRIDLKSPVNKLRHRCCIAMALITVVLLGLQAVMGGFLADNKFLYAPRDTITDLQEFKKIITEPKTEEGYPMYVHDDRNDIWIFYLEDGYDPGYTDLSTYKPETYELHKDEILKELLPNVEPPRGIRSFSESYGYQFSHLNRTIVHYEISNTDELLPIYIYNTSQMEEANRIFVCINLLYLLTYLMAVAILLAIYNTKKNGAAPTSVDHLTASKTPIY